LLKKGSAFIWTDELQLAFEKAREQLATPKTLTFFDHRRPTRLYTDASRLHGLGFVLKQDIGNNNWRVVQAGSRFLSSAETRYAMIELELLAFAWAAKKAAAFLEGISFELITDHKPLKPILEDYALSDIDNKRLQRLKMKVDHLQFTVRWIPGKENVEADALSRAPIHQATPDDEIDENNEINAVEICLNHDEGLEANILDAFAEEL